MNSQQVTAFQRFIHTWFERHGRHHLPWRQDFDPYKVMVSEIMLQQTQVERVIPKFEQFITSFPTSKALATASTAHLLQHWQGLGYNRRALNLQRAAQAIEQQWGGVVPTAKDDLLALPGIGPYTASAIRTFAFNQPEVVIETNIRTIFIYHFFPNHNQVTDQQLEPLITMTLDHTKPRQWYSALMDYGTHLKSVLPNPTRRSKHYTKQSRFVGSNRQLRGAVLKQLTLKEQLSDAELLDTIPERQLFDSAQISAAIETLTKEGFIERVGSLIQLKK
jgi:A/G-specific adenine glycosylase